MFAQTQNSFEEVALKFIRLQEKEALKTFLLKKLAGLRPQVMVRHKKLGLWLMSLGLLFLIGPAKNLWSRIIVCNHNMQKVTNCSCRQLALRSTHTAI